MANSELPEDRRELGVEHESDGVELREPHTADVDAIVDLLEQLGYPSEPEQVVARIDRLRQDPNAFVQVAERDGRVLGVVAAHLNPLLERGQPSCRLTALVVNEEARGSGIGAKLETAVVGWARQGDAFRIELTSSDRRDDAHAFYEAIGYGEQSGRFVKPL